MRQPPQFPVDNRHQLVERARIAATPLVQEHGDAAVGFAHRFASAGIVPFHRRNPDYDGSQKNFVARYQFAIPAALSEVREANGATRRRAPYILSEKGEP